MPRLSVVREMSGLAVHVAIAIKTRSSMHTMAHHFYLLIRLVEGAAMFVALIVTPSGHKVKLSHGSAHY